MSSGAGLPFISVAAARTSPFTLRPASPDRKKRRNVVDKEKQQQQFPLVKKTDSRDNSGKKQCRNYNKIWYEIKKKL